MIEAIWLIIGLIAMVGLTFLFEQEVIYLDELLPQHEIEQQAEEFSITDIQERKFDELNERLRRLQIKFEANKIQRNKDYGGQKNTS